MVEQQQKYLSPSFSEAADWRALNEQLGSPEEAADVSASVAAASLTGIHSAAQLRDFVGNFQTQTLVTSELPAILAAYNHARRNEGREIIELDRSLKTSMTNEALASASTRVGRNQLRRMRALRHEKVVAKYWDAVRGGDANAWHTVVFGVTLAIYSIPLRQGLHHYSHQTVRGFLESGAATLRLPQGQLNEMEAALLADTPALVERLFAGNSAGELRCV